MSVADIKKQNSFPHRMLSLVFWKLNLLELIQRNKSY